MTDTSTFVAVDLSRLPAPTVIAELSYDTIRQAMLDELRARLAPGVFDALVASDPAIRVLEVAAYREFLLRGQVNDAARGVMVAFATGSDLDHLAALAPIARLQLTAGDPLTGVAPTYESDDDFRRRLVLAPEGYSVAGPAGAYIFHALSAAPDVLDASVTSPSPGDVVVTILARSGDGTASAALLATVAAYLGADQRRPLTDHLIVQSAEILPFAVQATITTFAGPDPAIVLANARARLDALLDGSHQTDIGRLGVDAVRARIIGALTPEGVQNVNLVSPAVDRVATPSQAARCSGVTLTLGGIGE